MDRLAACKCRNRLPMEPKWAGTNQAHGLEGGEAMNDAPVVFGLHPDQVAKVAARLIRGEEACWRCGAKLKPQDGSLQGIGIIGDALVEEGYLSARFFCEGCYKQIAAFIMPAKEKP